MSPATAVAWVDVLREARKAAFQEIADIMNGLEWDSETLDEIAELVRDAGCTIDEVAP